MLSRHHLPHTEKNLYQGAVFVLFCGRVCCVLSDKEKRTRRVKTRILTAFDLDAGYEFEVYENLRCRILPYVFYKPL